MNACLHKFTVIKTYLFSFLFLILAVVPTQAQDTLPPITEKDILSYLEQVISWNQDINGAEPTPETARENLLKAALKNNSKKLLQYSFDFARVQATLLPKEELTPEEAETEQNSRRGRLRKVTAETDKRVLDLQAQLDTLAKDIRRTTGKTRQTLTIRREQLTGELKLAKAQQELLKTITGIFSATSDSDIGGLSGKIENLARGALPSIIAEQPASSVPPVKAPVGESPSSKEKDANDSQGMISIASNMVSVSRRKDEISNLIDETDALLTANQALITSLRSLLQDAIKQGNTLANSEWKNDAASIAEQRKNMDALITHYKQLSASVIPLGQVSFLLEASNRSLQEWRNLLDQDWTKLLRQFIFRIVVLGIAILVPIVISELARRAINRYVHDPRRKKQLRLVRRVLFVTALLLVVFLNFVSEFGSLATFAGFLTAGLAVSLQTVLVSLTAHFFFFGRFGVRPGDRVTIAGVTGDVVQVGMLRIYLMELVGSDGEYRPSGKIVAFPNSILFGTNAFFKHVAGANYTWNDMTFLLDEESDYPHASEKVMDAVNEVYAQYKETIELQHTALEQSTRLSVKVPAPRSELTFTDKGLACVVHYPVVMKNAAEVHQHIIRALIEKFRATPQFRLVLGSPLRIEAAHI